MAHEITEKDGMFSVQETPWHKLGVVLDSPPTIAEAIVAAKLDWQVGKKSLFYRAKDDEDGKEKRYKVTHEAVVRMDTNDCLGVVGSRYTPLQNVDAFNIFQPLLENKLVSLETAGSLKGGVKVWVLARILGETEREVVSGDSVKLYCLLSNSHDGTSSVRFGFTPVRVVCNNTLTAAHMDNGSKLIKIFHSKDVKENVEKLRDAMNMATQQFEMTISTYQDLATKMISAADLEKYVKVVFEIKEDSTRKSKVVTDVVQMFEEGRGASAPSAKGTAWAAYNAVNEYFLYSAGRSESNRLDSMWFGYNGQRDAKALKVAQEMFLTA